MFPPDGTQRAYQRRRPETTPLYEVVRDNLATLDGAIDEGALEIRIGRRARRELDSFLDCGMLWRGFARLRCEDCKRSRLLAFSCKGRGFCPACLGRRMNQTAANLMEYVLPAVPLRQWVLTFPFAWRGRLAQDGALLGRLSSIFVDTVLAFYAERAAEEGATHARSGALTVLQRASADMKLNPHVHSVALDGAWYEHEGELVWQGLGHLRTNEVAAVLERTLERFERHLRRKGLLRIDEEQAEPAADPEAALAASAVAGQTPPAGPQWRIGLPPIDDRTLAFQKPLCVAMAGFTLHAATHAGGADPAGRDALLRYVLRPPLAQDRLELRPDGSVRIHLKKPFADGAVAVDMDPLSLLCRLAAVVPPPRYHTVRYAGVLAAASPWRARIAPAPPADSSSRPEPSISRQGNCRHKVYRPWAALLARTFAMDALACPHCQGRLRLMALIEEPDSIARFLTAIGEPQPPPRSPPRPPPYWRCTRLRRRFLDELDTVPDSDHAA